MVTAPGAQQNVTFSLKQLQRKFTAYSGEHGQKQSSNCGRAVLKCCSQDGGVVGQRQALFGCGFEVTQDGLAGLNNNLFDRLTISSDVPQARNV